MSEFLFRVILHPAEEGGYWVDVPALPGCVTEGADFREAVVMAADAMKTYVAALLLKGEAVPPYEPSACPEGCHFSDVYFETDETYVVPGARVSAAEAARMLGVSAGRVTHMLESGILEGYRVGRSTYVTMASVERRLADGAHPGRPRKAVVA